ncbi:MAG: EAL domain-containing protein [Sinobacterium sp.]|nr:EAL domain-containing protein [Sinobacterium sp.]
MSTSQSFNILLQVQSQNDAENIISLFRAARIATRAHRITSEEDLTEHLNDQAWDIIIFDGKHAEVSTNFSLKAIQSSPQDIPSILINDTSDDEQLKAHYQEGISAVVNNPDTAFIQLAHREMSQCAKLRHFKTLEAEFTELQSKADKLLSDSDDALAFVSDGIIIQCNDRFIELFAYNDVDDLDCASIIDLVADEDHKRFKTYMKHFAAGNNDGASLTFQGLKESGDLFEASLTLESSSFDGEACTQFSISSGASQEAAGGSAPIDNSTGLYNRYYLLDQIASTGLQASNGSINASLLSFSIDDLSRLFSKIYISGMDVAVKDIAEYLQKYLGSGDVIARLSMSTVGVILQKTPEEALEIAKEALKVIEKHICELPGKTIQFTCSCSILNLNTKNADFILDQTVEATYAQRLKSPKNSAQIYAPKIDSSSTVSSDKLSNIQEALEEDCFKLLYQPLMSLMGDERENYEVQCLMEDANGLNYPEAIINSATDSKLDRWIILESSKALALRVAEGHNSRLIINLTTAAIKDSALTGWLGVAIKAANLHIDNVIFQFREEDIRNNLTSAIENVGAMQSAGYHISVKNFGKGDDPFKLVEHIKIDMVRIDDHFTTLVEKGDITELQAITTKAKESSIKIILPEVANANAMATIWTVGCDFLTGDFVQSAQAEMNYVFEM